MRMNKIGLLVIFWIAATTFGQEKLISGKIIFGTSPLKGIEIINLVNDKTTISENDGTFSILAKADDLLVFASENYRYRRKIISEAEVLSGKVLIELEPKPIDIDEIFIFNQQLDAVKMGILSKPAKRYTPAERRLKTASEAQLFLGPGMILMPTDFILNAISGRTKLLKKELAIERKEMAIASLENLFDEKYIITSLQIPKDYVGEFKYFAVEQDDFGKILQEKNRIKAAFLLTQISQRFKIRRGL
ncbi:hypothetical protein GV828_05860 [Flavobacterium sp. NST-5]|uniref:TonB-dependent receptor n=1 Tax=Flavobacterium ichthyis TaxID=2698827 RepID=A0ABW9Z7W3_9FLAO|nr:hypothetical protein [Flavobacterium ichthyis]NBL64724.1 hypothetical protein [Flavobacterium ichthyis]